MRAGLHRLRLHPDQFWTLTPAELDAGAPSLDWADIDQQVSPAVMMVLRTR